MNRGCDSDFHDSICFRIEPAVNQMWKLCMGWDESRKREGYGSGSEELGRDFQHEGWGGNRLRTGRLAGISTSANRLLLLLVL
jgi:hypothetical protein